MTRTTRSVSRTDAGQHLVDTLRPTFDGIEAWLDALRSRPAGTIRLTSCRAATERIVLSAAQRLMADHPQDKVELTADARFTDIAREGFDAGIRLGESLDRDMIGLAIGLDLHMLVAASPDCFRTHAAPQTPHDLSAHNRINRCLPTAGRLYVWGFEKAGPILNGRVEGQFTCSESDLLVNAALIEALR